jgi:HEAT repeat protein
VPHRAPFKAWLAALALLCASAPAGALIWPTVARSIERDLGADEVTVRRRAAERLRELPGPMLARAASRALGDPDVEVRLAAAQAARRAALPGLGERLIPWLTESDVRLRIAACEALTEAPSARGVAPLVRALSDAEPAVRRVSASALGASGAKDAVIGLLGRLDDPAVEVREAVVRALSSLSDVRAVVPLISKIEDTRPSVRRAVAHALGSLGDRRATSALVLALRDGDPSVRAAALSALGALGDASSSASVASLLTTDTIPGVRRAAIAALGRLANSEAIAALVQALGAASEERDGIVAAFARIGPAAAAALVLCLRAARPEEQLEGCALALSATRAKEAGPAIREALERGTIGPEAALIALGRAGDPETLAISLGYLGHADASVRRAALGAAGALLDPRRADGRAVEPLELAFERGQKRRAERLELIRLLGRTGSPRAARLLTPIAERADDMEFRLAALAALAELGADAAPQTLLKALADPEPSVRLAAALAIRRSAPRGLDATLLERVEHGSAQDRRALGLALAGAFTGAVSDESMRRAVGVLGSSRAGERDALIEAIGHATTPLGRASLGSLASSPDPADRAKMAGMMAFHGDAASSLTALAADLDPAVRANALWALGAVGAEGEVPVLLRAFKDVDAAAAANAAAALGRVAARHKLSVERELCEALGDHRPALRESALAALRLVGKRCADGRERRVLSADRSPRARLAAALLLRDVGGAPDDLRALERCVGEEVIGSVAAACSGAPSAGRSGQGEVLVFVVPAGETLPVPRAAFALVRPDGLTRHGASDRRGAVCETAVPDGEIELATYAALGE